MSNFSTKYERSVNAVHDVRRRMQAVLLVVLGLAIAALANVADGTVERLMTQATAQPTLVLPTIPPSATANEPAAERIKLDLNTADAWMLTAIPGVGDAIAARVIAYRAENGGFIDVRELLRVQGIGEKLYAVMLEYVEIR